LYCRASVVMPGMVMPDKPMGSKPLAASRILAWVELLRWGF
jgi:hypothetical protein